MEQTQLEKIVVSGRTFEHIRDTSFEQDIYIMQLLEESGLTELSNTWDVTKQDISEISTKVIVTAFKSGKLFALLGAVTQEIGKPWTKTSAEANALFFQNIRDQKDKEALKSSVVAVILGFFVSGLLSSKTSQKYSGVNLEMQRPSTEQIVESVIQSEGLDSSEIGTPLSGS